jgi:chromosome partitioning protein
VRTVAFVNNVDGVGKTTLVYHLAWILGQRGETVLIADLDPQANLTRLFLPEERLEVLWSAGEHAYSIVGPLRRVLGGQREVPAPHVERVASGIALVAGDPALSALEEGFAEAWFRCRAGEERAVSVMTALGTALRKAAVATDAAWLLVDTASNLGAMTRSALIASDSVVIPLVPDLFSQQGLRTLGPALRAWRSTWASALQATGLRPLHAPRGDFEPLGYVVMHHGTRESRSSKAYQRWVDRFPSVYRESVLDLMTPGLPTSVEQDAHCLAILKHYRSLMPMALKARKPVFSLTPADGAIGAHADAVKLAGADFLALANRIDEESAALAPRNSGAR